MKALLLVLLGASGMAYAADPPQARQPPQAAPPQAAPQPGDAADESLLEFLGTDDVGDAAWWEFLKKSDPRAGTVPPPPPDAKK